MDLAVPWRGDGDDIITRNRDTGKLETRGLTRAVMTISALAHLQRAWIKTSPSYYSRVVDRTSYFVAVYCVDRHQATKMF